MGWIMEDLEDLGAAVAARSAEPRDLEACREVLRKLHALGIKHGDVNRFNFLVRGDGKAVLADFETAERCGDVEELEAEDTQLEESLNDVSFRGGGPGAC